MRVQLWPLPVILSSPKGLLFAGKVTWLLAVMPHLGLQMFEQVGNR